jgi:hypothetical protein
VWPFAITRCSWGARCAASVPNAWRVCVDQGAGDQGVGRLRAKGSRQGKGARFWKRGRWDRVRPLTRERAAGTPREAAVQASAARACSSAQHLQPMTQAAGQPQHAAGWPATPRAAPRSSSARKDAQARSAARRSSCAGVGCWSRRGPSPSSRGSKPLSGDPGEGGQSLLGLVNCTGSAAPGSGLLALPTQHPSTARFVQVCLHPGDKC